MQSVARSVSCGTLFGELIGLIVTEKVTCLADQPRQMLFPVLSVTVCSAIFGIDFGSEYIKVSTVHPVKGTHILMNQQSKRLTPSYFAFWNTTDAKSTTPPVNDSHWEIDSLGNYSWTFFDAARSHARRFPSNSLQGFLPIHGPRHGFDGREVLALQIRNLIETIDDGKTRAADSSIVFTVEPLLPREERSAIAEAVSLSGASLLEITDAPTAAAYVYALERRKLFEDSPRVVAFFDIGASHTWAAVFRFTKGAYKGGPPLAEGLAVACNYTLGAAVMDRALTNLLIKKFEDLHHVKVTGERVLRQFYEEAKRAKEVLTTTPNVAIRLEDIVDDLGLTYTVTRAEFESLIVDFNVSLHNLFDEVVSKSGLNVSAVDSIELLGGTTRVPFVQQCLMTVSGLNKLNRTLNSDEAIALGAGYCAASRSNSFQLIKPNVQPIAGINATLTLPSGETVGVFNRSSRITDTVMVNVPATQLGNFTISCDGVPMSLFTIPELKNVTDDVNVSIKLFFDKLTVPSVYAVYFWNGTRRESLTYTLQPDCPRSRLPVNETRRFGLFLNRMWQIARERVQIGSVRNEYEAFIYRIRDRLDLDLDFLKVVKESERGNMRKSLEEHQAWIGGSEAAHANLSVLQSRLAALKRLTAPAENRADEIEKRALAFQKLNSTLQTVSSALEVVWPAQKSWMDEKSLEFMRVMYNDTLTFYQEKMAEQAKRTDTDDPVVTAKEIEEKGNTLMTLFNVYDKKTEAPLPTSPTPTPAPGDHPTETAAAARPTPVPEKSRAPPYVPVDVTGYENDDL
jgi:heat shock protein 4